MTFHQPCEINPGGNFPRGNCPGGNFPGGNCPGAIVLFPWNCYILPPFTVMILRGSSFICKNAKQSVEYSCYGRNYDSIYKCKNINNPLKFRSDNSRTKKLVKIYFSSLTSKINLICLLWKRLIPRKSSFNSRIHFIKLTTDKKNLSSTKTQLSQFIFPVIFPYIWNVQKVNLNMSALMALTDNEVYVISVITILNILQGINISFIH